MIVCLALGLFAIGFLNCGGGGSGHALWSEILSIPFVYHMAYEDVTLIDPLPSGAGDPLPDSLVMPPGDYVFAGAVYPLWNEGAYRFVIPGQENNQRLVYAGGVENLLSGLSWVQSHGYSDGGKTTEELKTKAQYDKLSMACGDIAKFAVEILQEQGVRARLVCGLTLEEWNGWNDGHTAVEVFLDPYDKWVFCDLDNNAYYVQVTSPISVVEFSESISQGDYEIERIAGDFKANVSDLEKDGFDYLFATELNLSTDEGLRAWLERVMQVPMIYDNGLFYFFDAENRERIESHSAQYRYMEKSEFMEKFYQ